MKKHICLALAFPLLFAVAGCHDDDRIEMTNQQDRNFMMNAGMSNRAEIEAGQMAANKGENPEIRNFGSMMVSDHQTAQTELMGIADQNGGTVADSLDAEHRALSSQLNALSGRAFDSLYIHSQVKDHEKAINLFESEINNGGDPMLKDYANKYLPKIRMHHDMAVNLASQY